MKTKIALFLTLISTFAYADNIPTYYAYEYNRLPEDVEVIEYNEPTVTTTTTTYKRVEGRQGIAGSLHCRNI